LSIFLKNFNLLDVDRGKLVPASIEVLTFDWDGTLLNSKEATLRAYQVIFREAGIPLREEDVFRYYSPNWYRTYKALGLPEELYSWADNRWLEVYRNQPRSLMDDAPQVLQSLKGARYTLALLTAANRNRLDEELRIFNLQHFFHRIVCMEDYRTRKPDPLPLLSLIEELHTIPEKTAYIGDAPEDVEMGKRAGVYTVAVKGPYVSEEILIASNPSLFVRDLSELAEIFNSGRLK
jgi:HAD superfamily hydrolase (TIGR01549 family)